VDHSIFGVIPLLIGIEMRDPAYVAERRKWADRQWENPLPTGFSAETRFWIDDMLMSAERVVIFNVERMLTIERSPPES
jgi:hypothetical protein